MTATPPDARPLRGLGSVLGIVISIVALAGVVWWALRQEPPQLPHTAGQVAALIGAIALYGVNTLVRSERWHRLLLDDGAHPLRADSYSLTVVGYAVNNVLPARAGDAVRVVLMAPRAECSKRTVLGTIVAERLLDVGVILVLFLVVGYAVLGEVGAGSIEWVALATTVVIVGAAVAVVVVRRNQRVHDFVWPMLSSTAGLPSAHGALLIAMTFGIWIIESFAWIAVGLSVGFAMSFLEGLYLVALASVFALIPSGPGYAGTQDAAAVIGIKAIGGTGATAVSYLVMLRFALLVPITLFGLVLLAVRYGGLGQLRAERARARRLRRPRGELIAYGLLVAVALALRFYELGDRPFHHDESQDAYFSWILWTKGDYAYNPLLHGPLRFYLTAGMYALFGDSDFTARLAPALMGTAMVAMPYFLREQLGRVAAFTAAVLLAIGPPTCTSRASPARTSTSPRSASRCWSSCSASSTRPSAGSRPRSAR